MENTFSEVLAAKLIMLNDPEQAGAELFKIAEECLEQEKNMQDILVGIVLEITKFDAMYSIETIGVYANHVAEKYKNE